jgi:hypothetical protein
MFLGKIDANAQRIFVKFYIVRSDQNFTRRRLMPAALRLRPAANGYRNDNKELLRARLARAGN